jgi:hypothetical protein
MPQQPDAANAHIPAAGRNLTDDLAGVDISTAADRPQPIRTGAHH